jgi:hypothetical protein
MISIEGYAYAVETRGGDVFDGSLKRESKSEWNDSEAPMHILGAL